MSSFDERIQELAEQVGDGALVGKVEVNQRYAKYQHERLDLRHEPGRIPRYLATPLFEQNPAHMQRLANNVLDGDLAKAMADNMEDLADKVEQLAPIDENDLPRSGHPTVASEGSTVYDRAPKRARLTEQELREKSRRRGRRRLG